MGYRVYYEFDDGSMEDLLDEVFETREAAEYAAEDGAGNYYVGTETLQLAGEDYDSSKIVDWEIVEEG